MTIYVDPLIWPYRGQRWCHCFTDGDLDELHAFAQQLQLKRSWFQEHHILPHYDLSPSKRKQAVKLGAVEVRVWTDVPLLSARRRLSAARRRGITPGINTNVERER